MKRTTLLVFILLFTAMQLLADGCAKVIALEHKGGPRSGNLPTCPDAPQAYYCYNDKSQWILIDGHGVVNYYDVEITSPVTNAVELTTQVDGTYDTFDISSLPAGSHVITIESPSGNIYEGTFTSY